MTLRHVWLLALLVACACAPPAATAIVVSAKTDLTIGSELTRVTYRVFAEQADPELERPVAELTVDAQDLSMPFVVTMRNAEAFLLSVEGVATGSLEPVVVVRERVRFEREKTLALRVFLARSCLGKRCQFKGLTCFGETRGNAPAGQCDAIPGPRVLPEVEEPGDESNWEPMPGPLLDAGRPALPGTPWRDADACHPRRADGGCGLLASCCS